MRRAARLALVVPGNGFPNAMGGAVMAGIDAATVRAQTDIGAFIGQYVALRPEGVNLVGLCPFHEEKTPSFKVHRSEKYFKCFGCQAGGDVIDFARRIEGVGFHIALARVAAFSGSAVTQGRVAPASGQPPPPIPVEAVRRKLAAEGFRLFLAWAYLRSR